MEAIERLKHIMWSRAFKIEFEKSTEEFFLLDQQDRAYASGKTIEDLVKSWDDNGNDQDAAIAELTRESQEMGMYECTPNSPKVQKQLNEIIDGFQARQKPESTVGTMEPEIQAELNKILKDFPC